MIKDFNYGSHPVTFCVLDAVVWADPVTMAAPFKASVSAWLSLPETTHFIGGLETVLDKSREELVLQPGGENIWLREEVAVEFARFLSPAFACWFYVKVRELHAESEGGGETGQVLRLLDRLRDGYRESLRLERENRELHGELERQAHKVEFYDKVHSSAREAGKDRIYRASQIASELGMKGAQLNLILQAKGVQRKRGRIWELTDAYKNKGYERSRTFQNGYDEDGEPTYGVFMVWTARGREFVLSLFQ